jgi:hypothetical protein
MLPVLLRVWLFDKHLNKVDVQFNNWLDHFLGKVTLSYDQRIQVLMNLNSVALDLVVQRAGWLIVLGLFLV